MNELAMNTQKPYVVNTVYNTAYGDRNILNNLVDYLKDYLSDHNPKITDVVIGNRPNRAGDKSHSLDSIEKAKSL